MRVFAEGFHEDVGQQAAAACLETFDSPHQRGLLDVRFEVGEEAGEGTAGHDGQDEFCRPDARREVIADGEVGRQGDAG